MAYLTARLPDLPALRARLREAPDFLVIGLCAAWCGTYREFEEAFARLAAERPEALFLWLDIEDDSALVGDIDVEDFPTLAVFRGARPRYFGVSLPQEQVARRVLQSLAADAPEVEVPPEVRSLPERIAAHAG
ncbi:MAG: thioredoxin family protein [Usitatibacter sp.]